MKAHLLIPCFAMLSGCVSFGCKPPPISPLVIANCPDIQPPGDDSFGATTNALVQVAGQYRKCQAAALGEAKKKPAD